MGKKRFVTAKEGAKELGVSLTTLYAYVSRGLVRSEATAEKSDKRKRYAYEDIERLKSRKELRREPNKAAERALHWGTPILQSSITMIANNKLYYRGKNAVEISKSSTVEEVALLLWEAEGLSEETFPTRATDLPREWSKLKGTVGNLPFIQQFLILLPIAEGGDSTAYDLTPQRVTRTGSRIVRMMASVVANRDVGKEGIGRTLARTWGGSRRGGEALINAALILCADHELNVSSFTARCVASAGSNPYGAIIAGLSALKGTKHGGQTARVEALLREIGKPSEITRTITDRLSRGEDIPGFGHTLYPDGDPRGRALLDLTYKHYPRSATTKLIQTLETEMRNRSEQEPTIDLGLVAIARNLSLPPDGAITLFALGRVIGWIAHALEQYKLDSIIRPRAKYVGRLPEGGNENQSLLT